MSSPRAPLRGALSVLLLCLAWCATASALEYQQQSIAIDGAEQRVRIPAGYRLELLTTALDGPRMLTFAANGELLIGSKSGNIYRLTPPYTRPEVLLQLPDYPHSVAVRKDEILIAQTSGLYRAPYRPQQARIPRASVSLVAALPGGGGHSSRTVRIGPDGRVYVSLGISGNCSDQYLGGDYRFRERRGGVLVLDESGNAAQFAPFASGLRNPVGFDWNPRSGVMYASNNGPDHHGFEQPPEYFSRLTAGSFHGMPWFQFDGQTLQRDSCAASQPPRPRDEVTLPVATFPARSAPMAVAFVPQGALGPELNGDAVVAVHGSWGTRPAGGAMGDPSTRREPKLVRVLFSGSEAQGVEDLVTGFQLADGGRWARPVGVTIGPDGALYFTSDGGTEGLFRLSRVAQSGQSTASH